MYAVTFHIRMHKIKKNVNFDILHRGVSNHPYQALKSHVADGELNNPNDVA